MKKQIFLLFIMLAFVFTTQAQTVSLLTFGGYTFKNTINYANAKAVLGDGFQWGGGFEVKMDDSKAVELIYQRMDPTASIRYFVGSSDAESFGVGVNYIMAGGTHYFPLNEMISAFGTVDLGVGIFDPKDDAPNLETITRFAWGIRGGLQVATSERISLRIHAQLLSPVQGFGGGVWFGSGGASAGVTTYSTIYQFDLGGSLIVKIR
jgi:hypothetical protein